MTTAAVWFRVAGERIHESKVFGVIFTTEYDLLYKIYYICKPLDK